MVFDRWLQMQVYIESLGCARNQVDSENMAGLLCLDDWTLIQDPAQADVIVVNTCSFVESAINESIDTILELARFKKKGRCKRIIVAGCLPERFREAITDALPEVDQFLGTGAFSSIVDAVNGKLATNTCILPDPDQISMEKTEVRHQDNVHTAYLKIAEGCSRHCTYCIIPRLRGRQKNRPLPKILEEAGRLIGLGVKELNLVAQDTTCYGNDSTATFGLDSVLTNLAQLDENVWIRFLYGHPESITNRIIETVASHGNLCPYFDLPVQHAAANVLKNMGRNYGKQQLLHLFNRIRSTVPGASIRTTLIVGFPGETDADFDELMDFMEDVRFDHLGVFTYSDAQDLPSHRLPEHVPEEVAQSRYDSLMARQMEISADNLAVMIGKTIPVLIEASPEPHLYEGRSMVQAPEVDGITFVQTTPDEIQTSVGEIVPVKITQALEYDLIGKIV